MRYLYLMAVMAIVISCNNQANKETKENDTTRTDTTNRVPVNPEKDTVFSAFGNEPFWHVALIENNKYIFHPMDGADVEVPWVAPVTVDSVTVKYASAAGANNIVLIIIKKTCSDGMSDIEHKYAADLTVNGIHYSGCGREGK